MAIEEVSRLAQYERNMVLIILQEFSIEIPDKEADAIHSGRYLVQLCSRRALMRSQSSKQSSTSSASPMVCYFIYPSNNCILTCV